MSFRWDLKAVIFWERGKISIPARFFEGRLRLLFEHITEPFIKQQREDELFVVSRVNGSPQKRRGAPEIGYKLLLSDVSRASGNRRFFLEGNFLP